MHRSIYDLSHSIRALRRSPRFTFVAILTLALGIAGNILVFSVINASFLHPLPFPDPTRLVILRWQDQGDLSAPAFFMVKNHAHSFSSITAFYPVEVGVSISTAGPPEYVKSLAVSGNFFQTLGIPPEIGQVFSTDLEQAGTPGTAVLSYALWTQSFNHDPAVLGRNLQVNGSTHTIIGVMPQGFRSYPDADVWLPLPLNPRSADPGSNYRVIGRLAPGISGKQAQAELDELAREYDLTYLPTSQKGSLAAYDLQAFLVEKDRGGLAILFAAVGFVFLIACMNVAVLILVRAAASTQEIAIRAALGPGKFHLVRLFLTEGLLLSLIGGILGLIMAKELLPLLRSWWPADLPLNVSLGVDGRVLLFTLAITLLSPLFFGLIPALKLSRVNIAQILANASRTSTAGAEQVRTVRLLVFGQTALTIMLLSGTLLLLKSLVSLYSVPLGFSSDHLLVAQVSLASERYRTSSATTRSINQIVGQLQGLPGVVSAAAVNGLPLEKGLNLPIGPIAEPSAIDHADEYRPVTPDYFSTLRISLQTGRFFSPADSAGSAHVAIINETMARRWLQGTSAIGSFIRVGNELGPQFADGPRQIVGVVSDIHERGPGLPPSPTVFIPMSQMPDNITAFSNRVFFTSIIVRTSSDIDLATQIRSAVQSADPDLPVAALRPFTQIINTSLARPRFITLLTGAFGAFALLLTMIGVHGLLSYQVRLRTREIAVRIALGAGRANVIRMVVEPEAKLIFCAIFFGLTGSLIFRRLLGSLLYNVRGGSLLVTVTTGLLLSLIAILVCLRIAIRAASIEPMAVLRNE